MNASTAIGIAHEQYAEMQGGMRSSAKLCLDDAYAALGAGNDAVAKARALKSLAYSVGIAHPDYIRVLAA
jgi:hypothetical protein